MSSLLRLKCVFVGDQDRECVATVGIDPAVELAAPGDKRIWLDVSFDDDDTATKQLLATLLSRIEPLLERARQELRVLHDLEDPGVVLPAVPRDSDGLDGAGHGA